MKRKYPAIRFLITSRNNLADCFSTGGELPFLCKRVNPLQDTQIQDFFKQLFGTERAEQEWQTLTHSNCMDILRSPMALAMYAYTLKKMSSRLHRCPIACRKQQENSFATSSNRWNALPHWTERQKNGNRRISPCRCSIISPIAWPETAAFVWMNFPCGTLFKMPLLL